MENVVSKDGTSIAYEREGSGPAIFIVAGALSDRRAAKAVSQILSKDFVVYTYDRRGRGDSGDTPPYAVEREVEDLAALIDAAGGPALVFGHSSGAVLALEAASRLKQIERLAIYEPPFITDATRAPVPADYVQTIDELIRSGRRGDAIEYFMTVAVGTPAGAVAGMRQSPYWPGMEKIAHTLIYDGMIMGDTMSGGPLGTTRWSSLAIPVLVMDGGASPTWARNSVEIVARLLPNGGRRTLEGQTHGADPAILAPVLARFFTAP
ncbi:MAG TPA: alpha/beta hydrolase [Spirochaetia bacterium]|nr:alpha/beta hydrolase [Spirochaetia bacterium]